MRTLFLFLLITAAGIIYAGETYNFFMISDPHFGAADTYLTDPNAPRKYKTKKSIHRADRTMHLYKALFEDIRKKSNSQTRFIVEAGDLVEGATPNEATHKKVLNDALSLMKTYFKYPIYMVKGNHDAFGLGGEAAYKAVLVKEIARYAGKEQLDFANYAVNCGPDLYIYMDFYPKARGFKFVRDTLKNLKTKPRYVFVILHCPMIFTYQFENDALPLCELLTEYNGILLAGHCHQNMITKFEKNGKAMYQVTVSTYTVETPLKTMRMIDTRTTPEQAKARFIEKVKMKKADHILSVFREKWAPNITEHRHFRGVGYAKFDVSDKGIQVTYQSVDLTQEPIKIKLLSR